MTIAEKMVAFVWRDLQEAASYRLAFVMQFGGLLMVLVSFFFLSRLFEEAFVSHLAPYGGDYFSFVLIGMALGTYTTLSLQTFRTTIRRSQTSGTMEALLGTQTSLPTVIVWSAQYSFLFGTIQVAVYLAAGALIFGADISLSNSVGTALALMLTVLSTAGLGIISGSFIMVLKQGDPTSFLVNGGTWILSGAVYPVSVLPTGFQSISQFLPMTHGLEAMRQSLLNGASLADVTPHLVALVIFAAVLLPVSLLLLLASVCEIGDGCSQLVVGARPDLVQP